MPSRGPKNISKYYLRTLTICSKKWQVHIVEIPSWENGVFEVLSQEFQTQITFFLWVGWGWLIYEKCCKFDELFENQHRGTQKTTRTPNISPWSHIVDFWSQSNITRGPLIIESDWSRDVSGLKSLWIWSISQDRSEQILEKHFLKKFGNWFFESLIFALKTQYKIVGNVKKATQYMSAGISLSILVW